MTKEGRTTILAPREAASLVSLLAFSRLAFFVSSFNFMWTRAMVSGKHPPSDHAWPG